MSFRAGWNLRGKIANPVRFSGNRVWLNSHCKAIRKGFSQRLRPQVRGLGWPESVREIPDPDQPAETSRLGGPVNLCTLQENRETRFAPPSLLQRRELAGSGCVSIRILIPQRRVAESLLGFLSSVGGNRLSPLSC